MGSAPLIRFSIFFFIIPFCMFVSSPSSRGQLCIVDLFCPQSLLGGNYWEASLSATLSNVVLRRRNVGCIAFTSWLWFRFYFFFFLLPSGTIPPPAFAITFCQSKEW